MLKACRKYSGRLFYCPKSGLLLPKLAQADACAIWELCKTSKSCLSERSEESLRT